MTPRHPLVTLGVIWLLLAGSVLAFALCAPLPGQDRRLPEATPTVRVLPTAFVFVTMTPAPSVTPRESVLAPTRTPAPPTPTFTPLPTRTPTTEPTPRPPLQRG